jgi:glycosyltransferase involved in cell wall biosynthesis
VLFGKRLTVVLPAYHAEKTLVETLSRLPPEVDERILVDDSSQDQTVVLAEKLGLKPIVHAQNRGYGANQKSCYKAALEGDAELVVMLHPDLQYPPEWVLALAAPIALGNYDIMLGSRMTGRGPREMPGWRWAGNRFLTGLANAKTGMRLTEYHTGFRAYSRQTLERLDFSSFSNDFLFDHQLILAAIKARLSIGELSCPDSYGPDASSISFPKAIRYGLGVLQTLWRYPTG